MGGIGKSTLAAQIATRVNRLQSGRVVPVVNGEVPASPYLATRADLNPGTPGPDEYVPTIEFGAPTPLGMLR